MANMMITTCSNYGSISALVKQCVDYLLSLKMSLGNYPGSLDRQAGALVHGASGVIHSQGLKSD